jgi:hypothetical protein
MAVQIFTENTISNVSKKSDFEKLAEALRV